jgi:hypothetical protein
VRVLPFFSVILTALALLPGGAHLFELPNKIGLPQEQYFVVQSIYRGWALFGVVIIAAVATNLLLALMLWRRGRTYRPALAAGLIMAATLVVFFAWTYPGQPGDRQLDGGNPGLGKAAHTMGAVARCKRRADVHRAVLRHFFSSKIGSLVYRSRQMIHFIVCGRA